MLDLLIIRHFMGGCRVMAWHGMARHGVGFGHLVRSYYLLFFFNYLCQLGNACCMNDTHVLFCYLYMLALSIWGLSAL